MAKSLPTFPYSITSRADELRRACRRKPPPDDVFSERAGVPVVQEAEAKVSRLYGLTVALFIYGWLSVNIYLPILPQMENVFHTTTVAARLTVTVFLIGFAFTQLVWGPLSDRFGRRPVLLVGLAISASGALLAGFADNIYAFAGARFLESVGLGVCPVVARVVLADKLDRVHVAIAMAYVAITVATVPAVAPIIGGYIDLLLSWRGIFFFLALYGASLFVLLANLLPETNKHLDRTLKASHVLVEVREMMGNPRYVGYLAIYGLAFGSLIGYYAAAPFIFVSDLGYSSHAYGYLLIFNVACYILGVSTSRVVIPKLGNDRPIVFALGAYALASIIFVVLDVVTTMNTFSVLLPMGVFIFGTGLVSPAANAGALTIFRDKAGAATAFVGFSIAIGGAIFSGALSAIHMTRLAELGGYVGVSTLASFVVYMTLLRRGDASEAGRS
jgi:DHA1 family bicyclomycin/chloramphenicol resistance-like MFS transporter